MTIIIVDDEPKAIELLGEYSARFTDLNVVGTFRNGLKALEFLTKNPVDIVLLDINMPHLNGMSLARLLPVGIKVIFTTAYAEHAVESYEVNATDYLLKPITFERFAQAISKIIAGKNVEDTKNNKHSATEETLLLKSGSRSHRVYIRDIYFLEKDSNYMRYHVGDKTILARQTISEAMASLPDSFLQVHRSFIVALDKIDYLDTQELKVGVSKIPVGAQFRSKLTKRFGQD